jgi:protein-L-isoaspartate(D-aspartate) O-methyltransferase
MPFATSPEIVARHLLLEGVRRLVPDDRVVAAMRTVPRELFVRRADRPLAYANRAMPAEGGGLVPEPLVVARVLSALSIGAGDRVLLAGGDGGYVAAIVCRLARDVTLVEPTSSDDREVERRLRSLGAMPAVVVGPPLEGWEEQAPYDAIAVTTPQLQMPPPLVAQLGLGGRLAVPMRDADGEMLARVLREGIGRLRLDRLGDVRGARHRAAPAERPAR